jgi:hypothetical protein
MQPASTIGTCRASAISEPSETAGENARRPCIVDRLIRQVCCRRLGSDDGLQKGYIKSIPLDDPSDTVPGWVMVFADSFFAAERATDKVKVEWVPGDAVYISEQDLQDCGAKLIADPSGGSLLVADPGVEAAFAAAKSTLERTYTTSSALHFQVEPVNALAFEKMAFSKSTRVINGNR